MFHLPSFDLVTPSQTPSRGLGNMPMRGTHNHVPKLHHHILHHGWTTRGGLGLVAKHLLTYRLCKHSPKYTSYTSLHVLYCLLPVCRAYSIAKGLLENFVSATTVRMPWSTQSAKRRVPANTIHYSSTYFQSPSTHPLPLPSDALIPFLQLPALLFQNILCLRSHSHTPLHILTSHPLSHPHPHTTLHILTLTPPLHILTLCTHASTQ